MQLGFVSAILPDLDLNDVVQFAGSSGFTCVELMCWPKGKAERRYAGVTHVDVAELGAGGIAQIQDLLQSAGVRISALGYYPNALTADADDSKRFADHIRDVVVAAELLGVGVVNSFIGRDHTAHIDANWPRFEAVWKPIIGHAEDHGVKIAIENCPMFFSKDEWPGGKNLAISPSIWRRMFDTIPSDSFGLNYDPSHLLWQQIDYLKPLREFSGKIFHVHAKDAKVDRHRLDEVGILACPLEYHSPKLPGLGDIQWGRFFSELGDTGYQGAVCIEVEDRAYEGSLDDRKLALTQSKRYLANFI